MIQPVQKKKAESRFTYSNSFSLRAVVALLLCAALCAAVLILPRPVQAEDKTRSRAERALREGEFDLAEKLFRELLSKDGRDSRARLGLSFALFKKRNLQDAFDHAARVIGEDPLSARAHSLLGAIILASGDFRRSIEEFRTALSLKGDDARAVAGIAMVDFYENRLDESVKGLKRAAFIDPSEPDYVFDLGQVAARTERYKEAANAYERFLAIAPKTDTDRRERIRGLIDFLRYLGDQGALYSPGGENRTSITFEDTSDRPILQVRVNGSKEKLRFVLDTGSGMSVLSEETAKRIGVKPVARGGMARAVGGGGRFEIVYGFLSNMEIGEARISNVPVYIRRFYSSGKPVDGYVGLSVISKYIATIDYDTHNFSLVRSKSDDAAPMRSVFSNDESKGDKAQSPGLEIPMRITSSGFLSGEVRIEGIERPLNFIIDTGADISVVSELLTKIEDVSRFAQGGRMVVYGAAGVAENVTALLLPRVSFGAHAREGIRAAVLDLEPVNETAGFDQMGILGANFLRHFRVTFDFPRAIVRLEPLQGKAKNKTENTPTEVTLPGQP